MLSCLLLSFGTSQAQWTDVTLEGNVQYNQIVFVDSLHGYIAANSVQYTDTSGAILFITTDGGKSWKENRVNVPWFSSVSAIRDSLVWVSSGGTVYYSHDRGNTWQHSMASNKYALLTVQFVDPMNGWACGSTQYGDVGGYQGICHSSDGGLTWKSQYADSGGSSEYKVHLKEGYFTDSLHGWVADYYSVRRTTDAGATWNSVPANDYMYSVYFLDTLRGWATGYISFYRTTDGGVNWVESPGDTAVSHSAILMSVYFADTTNGWICDNHGRIYRTTDGGATWSAQRSDTSGYPALNSIFFLNKNDGWAVGNGVILHTTNGGVTAVKEPKPQPKSFRLMQNYPNPFNPSTAISYQFSAVSYVTLKVYDILGRQVATLIDGKEQLGMHTITWNASNFPSGVYFYRLISSSLQGTFIDTKQMLMIK